MESNSGFSKVNSLVTPTEAGYLLFFTKVNKQASVSGLQPVIW